MNFQKSYQSETPVSDKLPTPKLLVSSCNKILASTETK